MKRIFKTADCSRYVCIATHARRQIKTERKKGERERKKEEKKREKEKKKKKPTLTLGSVFLLETRIHANTPPRAMKMSNCAFKWFAQRNG